MRGKIIAFLTTGLIVATCATASGTTGSTTIQRLPDEVFIPITDASVSPQEPRSAPKNLSVDSDSLTPKQRAKRYARGRLSDRQYYCIDQIFSRESRWRRLAGNPYYGPYGIPQALPGSKMDSAGDDWRTNSVTQTKWGIRYVNKRYGSACKAWYFWQRNHWY